MDVSAPKRTYPAHNLTSVKRRRFANALASLVTAGVIACGAASTGAHAFGADGQPIPLTNPVPSASSASSEAAPQSVANEPYVVFVSTKDAFTRCGPGTAHYRTDPLRLGQELEVYVETDDGWLGIRPTEKSFCWVTGDSVRLDSNGQVATVQEEKAIAWIGTNLGEARRYRWQVQLQPGEQIDVLEVTERESDSGSKTWLRIVPPSGEFRWVHRDDVVGSAEALAAAIAKAPARTAAPKAQPKVAVAELKPEAVQVRAEASQPLRGDSSSRKQYDSGNVAAANTAVPDEGLKVAGNVPNLRPVGETAAAKATTASKSTSAPKSRTVVKDSAIQIHRNPVTDEFKDRGAVIGSGLLDRWSQIERDADEASPEGEFGLDQDATSILSDESVAGLPANGAAAAASAIAAPLKKVSEVVANFISPPRIVQIDARDPNALAAQSSFDQNWTVGPGRPSPVQPGLMPPQSLGSLGEPQPTAVTSIGLPTASPSSGVATVGGVAPGGADWAAAPAVVPAAPVAKAREVSVTQIARVIDAMETANVATVDRWLSALIAESASADEMDPLIRRAEDLLRTGVIGDANRTRELLARARKYRYVAARRDGPTVVRGNGFGVQSEPVLATAPAVITTSATMSDRPAVSSTIPLQAHASISNRAPVATQGPSSAIASAAASSGAGQSVVPGKSDAGNATGYLVQVYSSRPNCPPYALTDDSGVTIAYVTPFPGVNLRHHLNSRVAVRGQEKLLEGMSTPHFLVDQVLRR
ncbi:hypothetical protein [Rhodopirellula sp. MGV]|uniref:hypothetical protein n=1 Tax=Rhodopirellula sp. MGV TaxID=2023130 RepID=UPI000B97C1E4|nr:hypothetical protein [Rhodopirellula sp. MGV]OYP35427.1 hypothetical protein CGZ80_11295 [Rhodopirellula sp. MGV]PNY33867.1 hypothetical protein C2E31_25920 [Rhodopirellula baltica]